MIENTERSERTNHSDIERIVMQRVHLIRALRFAISSGVLSTLLSFFALWGIGKEVWVARVFENAPKHFSDLPSFYWSAFMATDLAVQALVVLLGGALIYTLLELTRSLSSVLRLQRAY